MASTADALRGPASPKSEPCPVDASSCISEACWIAPSSAAAYCARCPPSPSRAPAYSSASNTRLLQVRRSTRSAKSYNDEKRCKMEDGRWKMEESLPSSIFDLPSLFVAHLA